MWCNFVKVYSNIFLIKNRQVQFMENESESAFKGVTVFLKLKNLRD